MKTKKTKRFTLIGPEAAKATTAKRPPTIPSGPFKVLTRRELDVVRLMAAGLRNREIGKRLLISEGTVKIHLHKAFTKLGFDSRLALGMYVKTKRLV